MLLTLHSVSNTRYSSRQHDYVNFDKSLAFFISLLNLWRFCVCVCMCACVCVRAQAPSIKLAGVVQEKISLNKTT